MRSDEPYSYDGLATSVARFTEIVSAIEQNKPDGAERLYSAFERGLRCLLSRQMEREKVDDAVHDIFLSVFTAIRGGTLKEPERLAGFVHTVARRRIFAHIGRSVRTRSYEISDTEERHLLDASRSPEVQAQRQQRLDLIKVALQSMPARDREILQRFYLHEETEIEIREAMQLTPTQFRLLKSRAKQRLKVTTLRKLPMRALNNVVANTFRSASR